MFSEFNVVLCSPWPPRCALGVQWLIHHELPSLDPRAHRCSLVPGAEPCVVGSPHPHRCSLVPPGPRAVWWVPRTLTAAPWFPGPALCGRFPAPSPLLPGSPGTSLCGGFPAPPGAITPRSDPDDSRSVPHCANTAFGRILRTFMCARVPGHSSGLRVQAHFLILGSRLESVSGKPQQTQSHAVLDGPAFSVPKKNPFVQPSIKHHKTGSPPTEPEVT